MNNFVYTPIPLTSTCPIIGSTNPLGYNSTGYNSTGYNSIGYISTGYNSTGYTTGYNPTIYTSIPNGNIITMSTVYPTMNSSLLSSVYPSIVSKSEKSEQCDLSQYNDSEATEKETECIICMTNKRQVVLNPCGHYNMCLSCTDKIIKETNTCPVCQRDIITAIKIFE